MVLVQGDENNRAHWRIGIVHQLIQGRVSVVRAVKLKAGKSFLERPIQFLYPMELHCHEFEQAVKQPQQTDLNVEADELHPMRKQLSTRPGTFEGLLIMKHMRLCTIHIYHFQCQIGGKCRTLLTP